MKKILFLIVCFTSVLSFGQMTMKKLDGTIINNGDVFTYTVLGDANNVTATDPAYLGLKIYNSSSSSINVKMKLISMTNSDGTNLQFCINPICVGTISVNSTYPASGPSVIPANGENGNFDHFVNSNPGNGTSNVEYVLKFYMIDTFGAQVGNSITITYRYAPTLGLASNDLKDAGVNVKSTLVTSQLEFDALADGNIQLFDLNGRMINSSNYISGYTSVDMSNLNASVYIASFTSIDGRKASLKIVKK